MAKKSVFICNNCLTHFSQWSGTCHQCGEWNSISMADSNSNIDENSGNIISLHKLTHQKDTPNERIDTQINEINRVCGGGLVPGSIILLGGDPGIGKSTILLQISALLDQNNQPVCYISGEESIEQIQRRASRINLPIKNNVQLASSCSLEDIIVTLKKTHSKIVIIDSIQTINSKISGSSGSILQVRFCTQELIKFAKQHNICLFLVSHVTKDGNIAGPKTVEHMVDTVLYFEGDKNNKFRILRTIKNRFGATDEIGIFAMEEQGLKEIPNPSSAFITARQNSLPGSCIFTGIEGLRPIMIEIQALISKNASPMPRRSVVGWDINRLNMIIAIIEKYCSVSIGNHDIYLNIAGGIKINDPAADMAVAVAILSSKLNIAIPIKMVAFGEIGLSGETRCASQVHRRIKESLKLGFEQIIMPPCLDLNNQSNNIEIIATIRELLQFIKNQ